MLTDSSSRCSIVWASRTRRPGIRPRAGVSGPPLRFPFWNYAVQQPHMTRNPSPLQHRQTPLVRLPVPLQQPHSSLRKTHSRLWHLGQISVSVTMLWLDIAPIKARNSDDRKLTCHIEKSLKLAHNRTFSGRMESCRDSGFYWRRDLFRTFLNL